MQRKVSASLFPKRVIPHTRFDDDSAVEEIYAFGRLLGQGSFGAVHLGTHAASGAEWAIKAIDKKKAGTSGARMLEFEVAILKRVSHDYIISLKEVFETPKKSYIVMELCRGGALQDHFLSEDGRPLYSQEQVSTIVGRLASAVAYLHDNDIAHRDLKLDNIMLAPTADDPLMIKVTDFGLCALKSKDGPQMQLVCGTPSYMAPEIIADNGTYSPLCDIWSTGVILYNLLSGQLPFRGDAQASLEEKIQEGLLLFPDDPWQAIAPGAKDLLTQTLHVDPAKRITAKEILDHPWISGADSPLMGGTVLEMMKQHALSERKTGLLGDELRVAAAQASCAPAAAAVLPPAPAPAAAAATATVSRARVASFNKAKASGASPSPSPAPSPSPSPKPLPNYMRPTRSSGLAAPDTPVRTEGNRVVRLPSVTDNK